MGLRRSADFEAARSYSEPLSRTMWRVILPVREAMSTRPCCMKD